MCCFSRLCDPGTVSVLVIPAIDVRGCFRAGAVYPAQPADPAARFIDAGARRIHVVNLDAARGVPTEESTVAVHRTVSLASSRGCAVEGGGGGRSAEAR